MVFFFSLTDGPLVMVQSLGHSVVFVGRSS